MEEDEEMYRMMNEEDPWFMGENETPSGRTKTITKTKNPSGRKKSEKKLKN